MATHSSILARRIPCREGPAGLQFRVAKRRTQTERFSAAQHRTPPKDADWLPRKQARWLGSWNFQSHYETFRKGEGLEIKFNQSRLCIVIQPPLKLKKKNGKDRIWRALALVYT